MFDWRRVKASETLMDGAEQSAVRMASPCSKFSNRYWPEAHSADTTSHMKHQKMVKPKSWGGGRGEGCTQVGLLLMVLAVSTNNSKMHKPHGREHSSHMALAPATPPPTHCVDEGNVDLPEVVRLGHGGNIDAHGHDAIEEGDNTPCHKQHGLPRYAGIGSTY